MERCDFCSASHPTWVYPARSFEMGGVGWGSKGAWAACEDCSQLIEAERYKELVGRRMMPLALSVAMEEPILRGHLSRAELRQVEIQVERLFNKFRRYRKGPRRLAEAA